MRTLARQRKTEAAKAIGENCISTWDSATPLTSTVYLPCRGRSGDEVQDYGYTMNNARRRSNSSTQGLADFRTKFETVEPEPVFEEQLHGPGDVTVADESTVTKVESTSSSNDSETDQAGMKY
jgi:hypothetical protein